MTRRLVNVMDTPINPEVAVYLFDIDGTCADHSARLPLIDRALPREERNWDKFHEDIHLDPPITAVCRLAKTLHFAPAPLIFLTGRMENQREKTTRWLVDHTDIPYWGTTYGPYQGFEHDYNMWKPKGRFPWLLMRPQGDSRDDTVVKGEWLDRIQAYFAAKMPGYAVTMAFEDRPHICALWQSRGLTVAKIGDWTEAKQAPIGEAWQKQIREAIGTDDEQLGLEKA